MSNKPYDVYLLFDIDGVLIKSVGYLEAYVDTTNILLHSLSQPHLSVNADIAECFVHHKVPNEWDKVPISIVIFLDLYAKFHPESLPFNSFPIQKMLFPLPITQAAFSTFVEEKIEEIENILNEGEIPTATLYRHCIQRKETSIFPHIWNDPVMNDLLQDALDIKRSECLAQLEARLLGEKTFHGIFGRKTSYEGSSYLETKDIQLISEENTSFLRRESGEACFTSLITTRPTLPIHSTGELTTNSEMDFPEGETVMDKLKWKESQIKLIGAGELNEAEHFLQLKPTSLMKPNPVHALAAMIASRGVESSQAILKAHAFCEKQGSLQPFLPLNRPIQMAVFEDSTIGVLSCQEASRRLNAAGYQSECFSYGIQTNSVKNQQLLDVNAALFSTVNAALFDFYKKTAVKVL